jgi:hypothetical protein
VRRGGKRIGLFSYGTLKRPEVQLATFGRLLDAEPDILVGHVLGRIAIRDPAIVAATGESHYLNVVPTGDTSHEVQGWY